LKDLTVFFSELEEEFWKLSSPSLVLCDDFSASPSDGFINSSKVNSRSGPAPWGAIPLFILSLHSIEMSNRLLLLSCVDVSSAESSPAGSSSFCCKVAAALESKEVPPSASSCLLGSDDLSSLEQASSPLPAGVSRLLLHES